MMRVSEHKSTARVQPLGWGFGRVGEKKKREREQRWKRECTQTGRQARRKGKTKVRRSEGQSDP